jgi:hypothetical protein
MTKTLGGSAKPNCAGMGIPFRMRPGAAAKLMGYSQLVRGHVGGIARGINIPNAQPDQAGLASVNPIFTWVRLAQRVPVRIHIDQVPAGIRLVAGMTATVEVHQPARRRVNSLGYRDPTNVSGLSPVTLTNSSRLAQRPVETRQLANSAASARSI